MFFRRRVNITKCIVLTAFTILGIQLGSLLKEPNVKMAKRSGGDGEQKQLVLVAVMTSAKFVNSRIPTIMNTWFNEIPGRVIFFSSEKTRTDKNVPLVPLKGVTDVYPPQKKSFMMMKYLYENHGDEFEWFMRVDDDMYIKADRLEQFLRSMDSRKAYFIGQPGTGIKSEQGRIGLKPGQNFCMGGPGIILSKTTLQRFVPHISECLLDLRSLHEDVEIGRCVSRFANVSCTWNYEMLHILYNHPNGTEGFRGNLDSAAIEKAINLHPIKDTKLFHQVHISLLRQQLRTIKQRQWSIHKELRHLVAGLSTSIIEEFNLRSKGEWTYLTSGSQYAAIDGQPVRGLMKVHENSVNHILDYYTAKLNSKARKFGRFVSDMKMLSGFSSFDSEMGFIYILDITYKHHKYQGKKATRLIRKRISALLPLTFEWHVAEIRQSTDVVNFIVPCFGRHQMLKKFLASFKMAFGDRRKSQVTLTVVAAKQSKIEEILYNAKKDLSRLFPVTVIWASSEFNRAEYRSLGANRFTPNDLLFFIDLDMVIQTDLLEKVRNSVKKGEKVYMPVVFSQNDNKYWTEANCLDDDMCISELKGFWRYHGFGMVGIYKQDLDLAGGWDIRIEGWGKEDVNLFESLLKANYTVFRPPDPSLVHIFHPKECDKEKLPPDQFEMCVGTRSMTSSSYSSAARLVRKRLNISS